MKKVVFLAFVLLLGPGGMSAMAEPGDLLQTFLNPTPTTRQVRNNFWVRSPLALVGKNLVIGFPEDDTFGIDAGKYPNGIAHRHAGCDRVLPDDARTCISGCCRRRSRGL